MHLAVSPVVLGRGEHLFAGIDLPSLGYRVTETVPIELATHIVLTRWPLEVNRALPQRSEPTPIRKFETPAAAGSTHGGGKPTLAGRRSSQERCLMRV
ncbi:hypothetical protein ASF57_17845 [Methylobacterium sp. Leaf117]|nr:hypothetical protein ASF57_17845 [Methylobacterium sp. Leaf117]